MEETKGREMTREELAELLDHLAGQVRRGELEVRGRKLALPARLEAFVEFKEKKGRCGAELGFRWPRAEAGIREEAEEKRAGDMKSVKKRLGSQFGALQAAVQKGSLPPAEVVAEFVAASREFAALAEPEYAPAMAEYMSHVDNLAAARSRESLEMIRHELEDLKMQMNACHREYK